MEAKKWNKALLSPSPSSQLGLWECFISMASLTMQGQWEQTLSITYVLSELMCFISVECLAASNHWLSSLFRTVMLQPVWPHKHEILYMPNFYIRDCLPLMDLKHDAALLNGFLTLWMPFFFSSLKIWSAVLWTHGIYAVWSLFISFCSWSWPWLLYWCPAGSRYGFGEWIWCVVYKPDCTWHRSFQPCLQM